MKQNLLHVIVWERIYFTRHHIVGRLYAFLDCNTPFCEMSDGFSDSPYRKEDSSCVRFNFLFQEKIQNLPICDTCRNIHHSYDKIACCSPEKHRVNMLYDASWNKSFLRRLHAEKFASSPKLAHTLHSPTLWRFWLHFWKDNSMRFFWVWNSQDM